MYKVNRTIYVDNQSIDVWFGLVSKTKNGKNGKYTVYLLTDDPNNPYNHAEPILSNITSKETAVRKAIEYTKELFHNILISQKNNNKSQEDNGKKSQSKICPKSDGGSSFRRSQNCTVQLSVCTPPRRRFLIKN